MAVFGLDQNLRKLRRKTLQRPAVRPMLLAARRQQCEARKLDLLVAELQHRMRNMFGLVEILVDKTVSDTAGLDDFISAFRGRLMALGRAQAFVSPTRNGRALHLEELLGIEIEAVSGVNPALRHAHLCLEGRSDVALDADTVQILSLAIHELATNSAKYGVLGSAQGNLTIRWWKIGRGLQEWVRIEWCETGLPDIRVPTGRRGFGRELIEQGLPRQLGARTHYTIAPTAVLCVIELPSSSVSQRSNGFHG